jgi:hypothetical protein
MMQSEAKRSRGRFSLQFAICREIFRNCRESRSIPVKSINDFNVLLRSYPAQGAVRNFLYCREEQGGIADPGQGRRRFPLCPAAPRLRQPAVQQKWICIAVRRPRVRRAARQPSELQTALGGAPELERAMQPKAPLLRVSPGRGPEHEVPSRSQNTTLKGCGDRGELVGPVAGLAQG